MCTTRKRGWFSGPGGLASVVAAARAHCMANRNSASGSEQVWARRVEQIFAPAPYHVLTPKHPRSALELLLMKLLLMLLASLCKF